MRNYRSVFNCSNLNALNPQPEPPGIFINLKNGARASILNGQLMLPTTGEAYHPAPAGEYLSRDGVKLVVGRDGQLDPETARYLHSATTTDSVSSGRK